MPPTVRRSASSTTAGVKVSKFGNYEGTIYLWDPRTGKEIKHLEGPDMPVRGLTYSRRGDKLVASGPGRHWTVFSMPDGKVLEQTRGTRGHGDVVLALYRQGTVPAAELPPFLSYLWEVATGKDVESGNTPQGLGFVVALPDGKTLVSGEQGGFLRFWDLESGKEMRRVRIGNAKLLDPGIYGLAYSPVDQSLIVSLHNGDLQFWSIGAGKWQHVLRSTGGGPKPFAVASAGAIAAATGDANGVGVRIWPSRSSKPDVVRIEAGAISSMQFSEDGKLLVVASWNGLHLIDVPGKKVLRVMEPKNRFGSVALAPNGKAAAAYLDGGIRLWDLESGRQIGKIAVDPAPQDGMLYFSPDGRSLLVPHKGGTSLWEVDSGQVRHSVPATSCQGFSPNGRLIFSLPTHLWSVDNRQILVWDLTGEQSGGTLRAVKHTPRTQAELWTDLQPDGDAIKAYRALWRLAADVDQTVPFLTQQVAAIKPLELKADADAPPALHAKILAGRIVELLEQIGTPAARRLLETLATPAMPQFTGAAHQALARLNKN